MGFHIILNLNVDTRSKFYCSQLVWAAYKDALGIDLNTSTYGAAVHPLELVNSTHTVTYYVSGIFFKVNVN